MSNLDPKILNKIKKCLALASSDNPHEAAAALRQANALMSKHGVSTHEVTLADIGEAKTASRTMSRDKPAQWECQLASMVGRAFGCKLMVERFELPKRCGPANEMRYIFVGLKHQVEIAAYTTSVLARKCKQARQKFLAETFADVSLRIKGIKGKKTRLGDAFADGWVYSISKLVTDFANPPEVEAAINAVIKSKTDGVGELKTRGVDPKKIGDIENAAAIMGARAAKGESLHRPMGGAQTQLLLGSGAQP